MAAVERRREVVHLHADLGWTFDRIGEHLGVTKQSVWKVWRKAQDSMGGEETIKQYRRDAVHRAELRIAELLGEARKPGTAGKSFADIYGRIINAEEHLAKLLGTYMPVRREVNIITNDTLDAEIQRLTEQLGLTDPIRETP
jgi:hypothetical protein